MIPKIAWPVVEEIRRLVPKPDELPTPESPGKGAPKPCLGWGWSDGPNICFYCPLGLLPYALGDRPTMDCQYQFDARPFYLTEAEVFWRWWDDQRDPEKAVAEVWEKELIA